MNREIKLRAWDPRKKQMYNKVGISLYGCQIYADHDNFPEELIADSGQDNLNIMQFIGLVDRNGKEIYEGDKLFHSRHQSKSTVYWNERLACFCAKIDENTDAFYQKIDESALEIIGNIYE